MSRIKMDYVEGVYRLIKNSSERGKFNLVFTTSLDKDPEGQGLTQDIMIAEGIDPGKGLREAIRDNGITERIWLSRDIYISCRRIF